MDWFVSTETTTVADMQAFIINSAKAGKRFLRIHNQLGELLFGIVGNFYIGLNQDCPIGVIVGTVVNHWDSRGLSFRITYDASNDSIVEWAYNWNATSTELANYLPLSGGTLTGHIFGSGGGQFLTDGNVYINNLGWLSDIINNLNIVSTGKLTLRDNPYINYIDLTWKKQSGIVWVSGVINVGTEIPIGTGFFFADGLPLYAGKQILGIAICQSGQENQIQRHSFRTYVEGTSITAYAGSLNPTKTGEYYISAMYIKD